ncbi:NAD(P)/FAD-dependent oxidoreductase [Nocardioides sp. DS6]|uniref:NAD(P)/FAD-dependent oxidoreductase n=1 Tax=Nocardioides eburneus TaxID=3231482 RepID=A0ABV3SYV3_9ACTN
MSRTVIVGASVGGVRTAQALRSEGYDGEIVLLERETELPYNKPPLSKALLKGTSDADSIRLLTREAAEELDLELVLGAEVTALDPALRQIQLADDTRIAYDNVVVATGADARPSPWGRCPGVHVVRTLADARRLRADLDNGGTIVVVGSGFIGAEVAATARDLGLEVHLVDPLPTPMSRGFEESVGRIFLGLHQDHGVQPHFGTGVEGIDGERGSFTVRLSDGTALSAGAVVVGIGADPNTTWLASSGLAVEDGLVCDQYLRAEGAPGVYAVGDVCRWRDATTDELIRVEHWTNAVDQALCVARTIVAPDSPRPYHAIDYVWSDQYDWKIQVVGHHEGAVADTLLGDVASGCFAVLYAGPGGSLLGAAVANWPKALITTRKAMAAGSTYDDVLAKLEPAAPRPVRDMEGA